MKWTSWPLRDLLAPYSMISWICVQFKLNGWPIHWQKSPISVSPPVEYCTCTLVGGNGTVRTSVWKLNVFYNYSSWLTSNINWCWSMMHFNSVINFPLGTEHWLPNQRAKSEKKKKNKANETNPLWVDNDFYFHWHFTESSHRSSMNKQPLLHSGEVTVGPEYLPWSNL